MRLGLGLAVVLVLLVHCLLSHSFLKDEGGMPEGLKLLIGVTSLCSGSLLRHTVNQAWGVSPGATVRFYCGHGRNKEYTHVDAVDLHYPPVEKNFLIWQNLLQENAKWYARCDDDSYLDLPKVAAYFSRIDTNEPIFTGVLGTGRHWERDTLGLHANFSSYVLGGPCEFMNEAAAKIVAPHITTCIYRSLGLSDTLSSKKNWVGLHSDIEFSRCVAEVGIKAREIKLMTKNIIHSVKDKKQVGKSILKGAKPCESVRLRNKFAIIHPVKTMASFLALSSPTTPISICKCSYSVASDIIELGWPREFCPVSPNMAIIPMSIKSYVLSLHDISFEMPQPFTPTRFIAQRGDSVGELHAGEDGYRKSMRSLLEKGIASGEPIFAHFDDDYRFHLNFTERWKSTIESQLCYHDTLSRGGVLLLGATLWRAGQRYFSKSFRSNDALCMDSHRYLFGSFAEIYTVESAKRIIEWLDYGPAKPYDHVWGDIVQLGVPVRAMWPPLVVMDVDHKSSVDAKRRSMSVENRHKLHKWGNYADYSKPGFGSHFEKFEETK